MARRRRKPKQFEQVELQVESLSHDGRGVAQRDGKCVFVDGALANEKVTAEITRKKSRYEEAKTLEILETSDQRVEPACAQAGICGGCSLQHLESEAQLELKQSVLKEQLQHFGGLESQELEPPTVDSFYHYRRKARLGVRYVHKKEKVLVGFREKGNSFIADINECHILDARIGNKLNDLGDLIHSMDAYRSIPQIEVAIGDDQVALVFRHLEPLSEKDQQALIEFSQQHNFELYLQPGGNDSVHKVWPEEGDDRLIYRHEDFDLEMRFHPMDFTQVNAGINRTMVKRAVDCLDPQPGERILDLFCGLGNFTLPLARSGAHVVGVEGSDAMVKRGYENAAHNNLENVEFHAADLTQDMTEQAWANQGFDKILIDPPRSGALEMVQLMAKWQPKKIVYVSCNPATLARDAGELKRLGYQLVEAGILDMFPHTTHVESLAVFEPTA